MAGRLGMLRASTRVAAALRRAAAPPAARAQRPRGVALATQWSGAPLGKALRDTRPWHHRHQLGTSPALAVGARRALCTSSAGEDPAVDSGGKGRVIVVGGNGFVGSAVCKRALVEGYEVVSLSR